MTESQWVAEERNPYTMLYHVGKRISKRKARLFACGCFRLQRPPTDREEATLLVVEQSADGLVAPDKYDAVRDRAVGSRIGMLAFADGSWEAAEVARITGFPPSATPHCKLVRCVLGNPFRPVAVDSTWLTSTVVALADGIYADRAFDRLPILADALQDAGCDHTDVLAHCRGDGPHVRGCWVVDLILGKS